MSKYLDFENRQVNRAALYDFVNAPYKIAVEQIDSNLQIAISLDDKHNVQFFPWKRLELLRNVDQTLECTIMDMIEALNNA